jgi:glutathione S-transferase
MKLHHFAYSSAIFRVRIALALKEIDVDYPGVDNSLKMADAI